MTIPFSSIRLFFQSFHCRSPRIYVASLPEGFDNVAIYDGFSSWLCILSRVIRRLLFLSISSVPLEPCHRDLGLVGIALIVSDWFIMEGRFLNGDLNYCNFHCGHTLELQILLKLVMKIENSASKIVDVFHFRSSLKLKLI